MCGIAGYLCREPDARPPSGLAQAMAHTLRHRGPDHLGAYEDGPLALGHSRLSIIDLRPEANQPMLVDNGALALVYNGEVYNFKALRSRLVQNGATFRSRSDTEVILQLYREKGLDFVNDLRGMFALALWDKMEQRLVLARDRTGQKPLFYHWGRRGLSFASELRALLLDPELDQRSIDDQALHHYLSLGYVPSRHCIFKGAAKVQPGSLVVIDHQRDTLEQRRYWQLDYRPQRRSTAEAVETLRALLADAVQMRMVSDVPLGAFLSGGIDSSAVVAFMAQASTEPVRTFSIGFDEKDYSEVTYARQVARIFGTRHEEEIMRPDAVALLPRLVACYGEPFADPSAVPTYLLSQMTRRSVTVALSGDGGDEAFAGYTRYAHERIARFYRRLPGWFGPPLAGLIDRRLPGRGAGVWGELANDVRQQARRWQMPDGIRYQAQFGHFPPDQLHALYTPERADQALRSAAELFEEMFRERNIGDPVNRLLDLDTRSYLPDDIFVKVDIASMAHSLEVRSPLVDHKLLEFAATLPAEQKLYGLRGKHLFRKALQGILPRNILYRRKRGFGIPHARWLRHELRSMAREVLLSRRARQRGFFKTQAVEQLLQQHDSGRINHGMRLWNLLWLELWQREFVDR
jgi:asparagine synthase (glutamine-hydrolysing)